MTAVVSLVSIFFFLIAFWLAHIVPVAAGALSTAQGAIGVMRDPAFDDEAREKAVQRAAVQLIGAFVSILLRSVATFAAALAPIYAADFLDVAPSETVIAFLARWDVILGASVIMSALFYAKVRLWPRQ